jgi:hypothetical protein
MFPVKDIKELRKFGTRKIKLEVHNPTRTIEFEFNTGVERDQEFDRILQPIANKDTKFVQLGDHLVIKSDLIHVRSARITDENILHIVRTGMANMNLCYTTKEDALYGLQCLHTYLEMK